MNKLNNLKPQAVFKYFEEITNIPRGSGNMDKISAYCMEFARKQGLRATIDSAKNVIIYKNGTKGYENAQSVILQGHLDMVCQQEDGMDVDFEKEGIDIYVQEDFIKANGTTLGADNGIAVAIILAILESSDISHPPIEAVFTTDEEIGMVGALQLSFDNLKSKRMINIDSEDMDIVTVSCAGGSDCEVTLPVTRELKKGNLVSFAVKGLRGGHSGVEINSGSINADILMGRILHSLEGIEIISVNGGNKGNAIPSSCHAEILTQGNETVNSLKKIEQTLKKEISAREPNFFIEISCEKEGQFKVIKEKEKLIFALMCSPNGVMEMSAEISGLVETSLNLGILKTEENSIYMLFTLRSNKQSAMEFLENRLKTLANHIDAQVKTGGYYPPWEYNENSMLRELYKEKFAEKFGKEPKIEAIHAGLECGVFSSGITDLDCISVGPQMFDIHTPGERVSISSVASIYEILIEVLKECK